DKYYGVLIHTLPEMDIHVKKLSSDAKRSHCYERSCNKGEYNVLEGEKYHDFVQELRSKVMLPKKWKFVLPEFRGFAMNNSFHQFFSYSGQGDGFELCGSPSMVNADLDGEKLTKNVLGGVLGKGSHFERASKSITGFKWLHLDEGKVLFPVYSPAMIGRNYLEGEIVTEKIFNYSDKRERLIKKENPIEVNCLEAIVIYPDKKVFDSLSNIGVMGINPFLTYHPNYQFKWTKDAEKFAYEDLVK
ncbi:MAG: hypothetical protein Q8Q04_01550, partial [archaeon]|nr:hypothetical protein [archaeon]